MRKILLAGLFALITTTASADTAPPLCTGRNLIDVMANERPDIHAKLIAEAAAIPNGEAILWKITGKEGTAPSFLFGTGHLTDPRMTTLPQETAAALDGASTVALELQEAGDLGAVQAKVAGMTDYVLLPQGETLQSRFTPEEWKEIAPLIPATTGLSIDMAQHLRPWLLASAFLTPACEMSRRGAGLPVLDEIIARRAAKAGKKIVGLETIESQISAFAGAGKAHENAYFLEAVRNRVTVADQQETMAALYAARKTAALIPLGRLGGAAATESARLAAEFMEKDLIAPRNRVMADHMKPLIEAGNAFIAVGALHLPGEEGLVALLRKDGYKVDPVN